MKKYIVFIITIIGILLFQSCIEGYFPFCEQVKTKEERCEAGELNCRKISRQDVQIEGINNHSFRVSFLCFFRYCGVISQGVYPHNSSIILSKVFNHSPPVMTSFSV